MTPITWYLYGRSGGAKKAAEEIGVKESVSGDIAVISDGADGVAIKSLVAEITPVQSGSGDPSPTNIRPISGRTGLTVTASGSNLLNIQPQSGTVSGVSYVVDSDGYITLNGTAERAVNLYLATHIAPFNSQVTISSDKAIPTEVYTGLVQQNGSSGLLELKPGDTTRTSGESGIAEETRYRMYIVSGVTFNNFKYRPMLNYGATALPYSPYNGATYPISWQAEAGEVYGGTLDVVSGVLTVDKAMATFDGSSDEVWSYYSVTTGNLFRTPLEEKVEQIISSFPENYACNSYRVAANASDRVNGTFSGYAKSVDFVDDRYPTVEDWRAALAQTPIQFVYPLATPQTYQLTPTEVRTILGGNTIYTDAGSVSVDYIADTKLYIDNKVAELQALILEN